MSITKKVTRNYYFQIFVKKFPHSVVSKICVHHMWTGLSVTCLWLLVYSCWGTPVVQQLLNMYRETAATELKRSWAHWSVNTNSIYPLPKGPWQGSWALAFTCLQKRTRFLPIRCVDIMGLNHGQKVIHNKTRRTIYYWWSGFFIHNLKMSDRWGWVKAKSDIMVEEVKNIKSTDLKVA